MKDFELKENILCWFFDNPSQLRECLRKLKDIREKMFVTHSQFFYCSSKCPLRYCLTVSIYGDKDELLKVHMLKGLYSFEAFIQEIYLPVDISPGIFEFDLNDPFDGTSDLPIKWDGKDFRIASVFLP